MGEAFEPFEKLPTQLGKLCFRKKITIGIAESCTGGLISHRITQIPGSSRYFTGSVVSYSNDAKQILLNVSPETIHAYGAVSEQTARQMSDGLRNILNTDLSCAVTGIAGPGGGSPEKPVGTVFISLSTPTGTHCYHYHILGSREEFKLKTSNIALELLIEHANKITKT